MTGLDDFVPDWVSAPGDTIRDVLTARGLSLVDFQRRMGQDYQGVRDLLDGDTPITVQIARRLEEVVGASAEFWIAREYRFRESLTRSQRRDQAWLDELPLDDMTSFGWVAKPTGDQTELDVCLRFFDQPTVAACRRHYAALERLVAFRKSPSYESRPAAVAAWLRQGEKLAATLNCATWDPERFRHALDQIRTLTRLKDPAQFLPKLQAICAECGVAVVVLRAPDGCRASGATRFLSGTKALLLLSFRYLSDDHFWFSFFHEAGHLLLHGENRVFVDGIEAESVVEEAEANQFSQRTLIPDHLMNEMLRLRAETFAVVRFASKAGISPGIVVGQLQHHGTIRKNELNRLKRRFKWTE